MLDGYAYEIQGFLFDCIKKENSWSVPDTSYFPKTSAWPDFKWAIWFLVNFGLYKKQNTGDKVFFLEVILSMGSLVKGQSIINFIRSYNQKENKSK